MLKKYLIISLSIILFVSAIIPSLGFAQDFKNTSQATTLNSLGLYKGVSTERFDPDLGTSLNRETGVVMLLRLFSLEKNALGLTDAEAKEVLAKFKDANEISSWAKKSVAYSIKNGLIKGTSESTISPKLPLLGKAYCTLILRQLGYSPNYDNAVTEFSQKGGINQDSVQLLNKELIKDDLVGISYGSLFVKGNNSEKNVLQELIDKGVVNKESTVVAGLLNKTTPAVIYSGGGGGGGRSSGGGGGSGGGVSSTSTPIPTSATPTDSPTQTPTSTPFSTAAPTNIPTNTPTPTNIPIPTQPDNIKVTVNADNTLNVTFIQKVKDDATIVTSAANTANYLLLNSGGISLGNPSQISIITSGYSYKLKFDALIETTASLYKIEVVNITDVNEVEIATTDISFMSNNTLTVDPDKFTASDLNIYYEDSSKTTVIIEVINGKEFSSSVVPNYSDFMYKFAVLNGSVYTDSGIKAIKSEKVIPSESYPKKIKITLSQAPSGNLYFYTETNTFSNLLKDPYGNTLDVKISNPVLVK